MTDKGKSGGVPFMLRELGHLLTGAEFKIVVTYFLASNSDGVAWPSLKTLAAWTGLNCDVIRKARAELVKRGWLMPADPEQPRGERNRFGIQGYRGRLPDRGDESSVRRKVRRGKSSELRTEKKSVTGGIFSPHEGNKYEGSKYEGIPPLIPLPADVSERTVFGEGHKSSGESPANGQTNGFFTRFWNQYPRKVGKGAAEKAFTRIGVDEGLLGKMLTTLERHKETEQWRQRRFIPHPATWLNQKRWEDVVEEGDLGWTSLVEDDGGHKAV